MKIDNASIAMTLVQQNASQLTKESQGKDFNKILNTSLKNDDKQELYKSCQELESVFLAKVFESMRASIPRSDFSERSFATETFDSMLFDEYSKEISKTSSIGIADILYRQLNKEI